MSSIPFSPSAYFLNPSDPEKPYTRRTNEQKISIPWGQRKLLITTLQFLTRSWDPSRVPNPVVVYAGAAPGKNIQIVSDLFPTATFHLYDPAKFSVRPTSSINLYNQYFTDADATKWSNRSDIFFISDIRTADYRTMDETTNEQTIWQDMLDQARWYHIIKPVAAHLKFRLPYPNKGIPNVVKYFPGQVFKQPWAPQTSTEVRLVPSQEVPTNNDTPVNKDPLTGVAGDGVPAYESLLTSEYDITKCESQLFHHNTVTREKDRYLNPVAGDESLLNEPELLNDYDSTCEAAIILDYCEKFGHEKSIDNVRKYSDMFTAKLNEGKHPSDWYTLAKLRKDPFTIKRKFKTEGLDD